MNRNVLIGVGGLLIVGVVAVFLLNSDLLNKEEVVEEEKNQMNSAPLADESIKAVDTETAMEMKELLYKYSGTLADVTEGEVRGINTNGKATGVAKSNWDGSQYLMVATFENLPEPTGENFYEGWIVQQEPFQFISTGKIEMIDGVYTNAYRSDQDLTKYNQYVLTIEPNDNDPAPAEHILEGTMVE